MATQILHPGLLARPKMTYKQFLNWDGENQHVEWVNGEVVEMAPIGDTHQHLGRWLISLLGFFVDEHELGVLHYEPFQMKTGPGLPGRAPDILFVSKKNLGRLRRNHLEGPADLVVEIISPGSRTVDRGEKFFEYEEGGVKEFWLIDPIRKQAEFYRLGRDSVFHPIEPKDGIFRSRVLDGLWLEVAWLWERPLPRAPEIWKRWTAAE